MGTWELTNYKRSSPMFGAGFPTGANGDDWINLTNYRKRTVNPLIETYFTDLLRAINPELVVPNEQVAA